MFKKLLLIIAVFSFTNSIAQEGKIFQGTKGHIGDAEDPGSPVTNFTCLVSGVGTITPKLLNNVTLNIKHTYTANLTMTLFSPPGTPVVLGYLAGDGENFTNSILTQNPADKYLYTGTNPFTGTFLPDGSGDAGGFELYNGESANGTGSNEHHSFYKKWIRCK